MKKDELKKVIKPLVKQCINEVLLEEGLLSTVIAEVMKGTGAARIVETTQPVQPKIDNTAAKEAKRKKLLEQKRKLLDSIGTSAYNGVDLFEGTTPTKASSAPTGTWIGTALAPRRSFIISTTLKKSAPLLSILLTKAIRGT